MKILMDADNGPHALILDPLFRELERRGHEVLVTARDRTNTLQLLDLYGIPYRVVGGEYPPSMSGKIRGTLVRAWQLRGELRRFRPDVTFGHGSRALPIASRSTGVPSVTMYDYEWVNASLFNMGCRRILLPDCITLERVREAGIATDKVVGYPGFKEDLYLSRHAFDPEVPAQLGLDPDKVHALLRPPATTAHYHNPEAEIIFDSILRKIAADDGVQLVLLARTPDQIALTRKAGIRDLIIPDRVYDGPSLIAAMDLVISGGGTMTREAAILGVPSYSFFRGRSGMVDETLEAAGKLRMLRSAEDASTDLILRRKPGKVAAPVSTNIINAILDAIILA